MELSILLTALLTSFSSPDLCADVYVDVTGQPYTNAIGQTWSRFCEWTGPSAPELGHDVCCTLSGDTARCTLPDRYARCRMGSKRYCDYGEVSSSGAVTCYQPFPSICDFGFCGDMMPPDGGPLENQLCCNSSGLCMEVQTGPDAVDCALAGGLTGYCKHGVLNEDGTIDCFD